MLMEIIESTCSLLEPISLKQMVRIERFQVEALIREVAR